MNTIVGSDCTIESMFDVIGGWTTRFNIDGHVIGGSLDLSNDTRLLWHMDKIGGVVDKRILELGPMEAAHTKMMIDKGAREIIAIEGLSDCFLRCLIVKEAFHLDNARFIFGDFCRYVEDYCGEDFDLVSAAGVLYHQKNPAKLIYGISKITNTVIVWSQVANIIYPSNIESSVEVEGESYFGKIKDWGSARLNNESYCASLSQTAFWMYPEEMRRCFKDAGFGCITEEPQPSNVNGDCLLFVASKSSL